MRNWANNVNFSAGTVNHPTSKGQVESLVKAAVSRGQVVRAVGTGHSFNRVADSRGCLISLKKMNKVIELDERRRTVKVEGGITYGVLAPWLEARGFALHNLASLPHVSVAGAVATGTHGSGVGNRSLSSAVVAMEVVGENGLQSLAKPDPAFGAAVAGIGAFGVVVSLTLQVQPSFAVAQTVYEGIDLDRACMGDGPELLAAMSTAYSVSIFTRYQRGGRGGDSWLWVKQKAGTGAGAGAGAAASAAERSEERIQTPLAVAALGGKAVRDVDLHPIPGIDAAVGLWSKARELQGYEPTTVQHSQRPVVCTRTHAPTRTRTRTRTGTLLAR